jgi:hypothetical protein
MTLFTHILVVRIHHFIRLGKVGPQLKTIHAPVRVTLGHLLVENAAPGGHPLHISCGDGPVIAHTIAVRHFSAKYIRDRFDTAMKVPGKPGYVLTWVIVAKVVKQQEWVEGAWIAKAKGSLQMNACTFNGGLALECLMDFTILYHSSPPYQYNTIAPGKQSDRGWQVKKS